MRTSQNPFSVYDLLAYLVPGLLAILGTQMILLFDPQCGGYTEEFWDMLDNEAFNIQNIIPIIIVAYLAGHLMSYISAIFIEKFSIWSIGYPTYYLFDNILHEQTVNNWLNRAKARFSFLIEYFTPLNKTSKLIYLLRLLILIILLPLILPLVLSSLFLNCHLTIRKPLDSKLATFIFNRVKQFYNKFEIPLEKNDFGKFDYFRPISHYIIEHCNEHNSKIQNYVALYGFNRNITLMFVFLFWLLLFSRLYKGNITLNNIIVLLGLMVFCLIFYAAFNKFYRRYSLEVLMALSANCNLKK